MKIKKLSAIYSIIIGIALICMWLSLLSTNQVPEINSAPLQLTYHLIAEFLTGLLLIAGGFGLIKNSGWGFHIYLISMGMLMYTVIASTGYYANNGDIAMVGMFTIFTVLTAVFIISTLYRWKEFKPK